MKAYLPLAASSWDNEEVNVATEVLKSGLVTIGENVRKFEKEFAEFNGSKYAVMVNSGSSANLLIIASLFYHKKYNLQVGDEVIVPAVSWSTTYYPLCQYGLKLKFVDIDINTLNYDLEKLRSATTEKTKLIVAVNLLGNPNDFDKIKEIINSKSEECLLIEDNCESLGAKYKGKSAGTFGIAGSFSSYFSHHISTIEGGIVITNDEHLYELMLSIRSHGWTRDLPENSTLNTNEVDEFDRMFRFILPGYNIRPLEISGAIGRKQLKKLPSLIDMRRKNAKVFQELFEDCSYISIQKEIESSSWFGFSIILNENASFTRKQVLKSLSNYKIEYRPIVTGNFVNQPVLQHLKYDVEGELKNAEYLDNKGLYIGNHHFDITAQLKCVRTIVEELQYAK